MSNVDKSSEADFTILFEAVRQGLDLQSQILELGKIADDLNSKAKGILGPYAKDPTNVVSDNDFRFAIYDESASLVLNVELEQLQKELSALEKRVAGFFAGMHLSIHVLEGDDRSLISNTYYSAGGFGSTYQQEFGPYQRKHRNGAFRAALLGQNALVLYPQRLTGDRMDLRNIIVKVLRGSGKPNIQIKQREPDWRNRMGRRTANRYKRRETADLARLRVLAQYL